MRHAMPSLAITLVLSILMSRLYLRLTRSRRSTNSCSSASEVANWMLASAWRRFVIIRPPICSPPSNPSRVSLITVSAAGMLNKYGERTQPYRTPFLIGNQSDSVLATLTLAKYFLYSLARRLIKCRGCPVTITVTQSLS